MDEKLANQLYEMNTPKVIVLLPVYRKDNPEYLRLSVDSMLTQTYHPLHVLIGLDGPIEGELEQTVNGYAENDMVTIMPFAENRGLAATLNDMILWAQMQGYSYYARMDADDISLPNRIDKQMAFLLAHPEIDVVGGATNEIDENGNNRNKINHYPLTPDECYHYFSKRDPLAHPAVLIKQSYFDKAGCLYRPDFRKNQDTMLWFDGLKKGVKIANLDEVVLNFRLNNDFFATRRNGYAFAKGLLEQRKMINRELHYGWKANLYAYALFLLRISPVWVKRIAYKIL